MGLFRNPSFWSRLLKSATSPPPVFGPWESQRAGRPVLLRNSIPPAHVVSGVVSFAFIAVSVSWVRFVNSYLELVFSTRPRCYIRSSRQGYAQPHPDVMFGCRPQWPGRPSHPADENTGDSGVPGPARQGHNDIQFSKNGRPRTAKPRREPEGARPNTKTKHEKHFRGKDLLGLPNLPQSYSTSPSALAPGSIKLKETVGFWFLDYCDPVWARPTDG